MSLKSWKIFYNYIYDSLISLCNFTSDESFPFSPSNSRHFQHKDHRLFEAISTSTRASLRVHDLSWIVSLLIVHFDLRRMLHRHLLIQLMFQCALSNGHVLSIGRLEKAHRDWSRREKAATRKQVVLQEPSSVPSQVDSIRSKWKIGDKKNIMR